MGRDLLPAGTCGFGIALARDHADVLDKTHEISFMLEQMVSSEGNTNQWSHQRYIIPMVSEHNHVILDRQAEN